jgi:hypothetical protein
MGSRQYAKRFAPWVAMAWLFASSVLLLQPCCEVLAAPVHGHVHSQADMHGGQHGAIPAPCDHLLDADLDSGLLPNKASSDAPNLGVIPAYGMPLPSHTPDGERQPAFRPDSSPPNPPAVFLTTQRFRI